MFNHHIDPLRIPPVSYSARMISKYISNDNGFFLRMIRDFLLNQEIIDFFISAPLFLSIHRIDQFFAVNAVDRLPDIPDIQEKSETDYFFIAVIFIPLCHFHGTGFTFSEHDLNHNRSSFRLYSSFI